MAPASPSSMRSAWRRCDAVSAAIRSAMPSTSVRSSLPFKKVRRVNSPGSAGRKPGMAARASISPAATARPPWTWISAISSPVMLDGAGK